MRRKPAPELNFEHLTSLLNRKAFAHGDVTGCRNVEFMYGKPGGNKLKGHIVKRGKEIWVVPTRKQTDRWRNFGELSEVELRHGERLPALRVEGFARTLSGKGGHVALFLRGTGESGMLDIRTATGEAPPITVYAKSEP